MKEEKMVDDHNGLGFQAGATYLLNYAKGIGLIQFNYPFENFRLDLISYHVY